MPKPTEKSFLGSGQQIAESHPTREEIELRAYQIYMERGSVPGSDLGDWLQAESELLQEYGKAGQTTAGTGLKIRAMVG